MIRITIPVLIFVSLVMPAMAQDAIAPVDSSAGAPIQMQDVDTNKDGVVSPEESLAYINSLSSEHALEIQQQQEAERAAEAARLAAENPKTYHPADINKDSVVTAEEQAAYQQTLSLTQPAPAPVKKVPVPEVPKEMVKTHTDAPPNVEKKLDKRLLEMKALDINNDGFLQAAELVKSNDGKFTAADANKDGILSPEETAASLEKFKQEKSETYGKAAANQEAIRVKNRIKNADQDRDGQVSKQEYEASMTERQSLFDQDGDGVISEDEYRTDGEKIPSSYRKKARE